MYDYILDAIAHGHTKEFLQAGGGRPAVVLPGPEVTVQKGFRAGCMSSRRAELYSFGIDTALEQKRTGA